MEAAYGMRQTLRRIEIGMQEKESSIYNTLVKFSNAEEMNPNHANTIGATKISSFNRHSINRSM